MDVWVCLYVHTNVGVVKVFVHKKKRNSHNHWASLSLSRSLARSLSFYFSLFLHLSLSFYRLLAYVQTMFTLSGFVQNCCLLLCLCH